MSYVSLPSSGITAVKTDGITIEGVGLPADPVALLQVQTDGVTITGDGTVASPLVGSGGGKPQTFAFMWVTRDTNSIGPLTVPYLQFPALDNGDWTETISSGDWGTNTGSLRCFKEGVYKVTGQITFELTELVPSNTEFVVRTGLLSAINPDVDSVMLAQGYCHANIESNTPWQATVHFQYMGFVANGGELFPFIETTGDSCDIADSVNYSSSYVVEEVSQ